ncbi:TonB-dependent receptor [Croceicoccus naphthovorans]|uniref:Uncharacterized protein n=1 Tax=Croceicoccus naphthovorans TaxID=1348774 RepID=A0A0G3XFL9_9SPHN|nr:TonB-dependent receptor [Croceicoccus naphthovorans]AKM09436.1 hypothetical protein AB433_04680 [Croceicoccus naphthovorans]MBB3991945.1 TonB-dependent receptor [Croceicoccus naphthovorans]
MLLQSARTRRSKAKLLLSMTTVLSGLCVAAPAFAQDTADASDGAATDDNTIVVEGFREVVRSSIDTKRREDAIVDAVSSEDIGNLPALSLSEVLETITGAGGHRGKGGGSEIAIRGLGPFLGLTTFNGRQATNGSGDRSVNFSQFPSELVNNVKVYKTQQADLVEGGVAGLIEIGSVRPLDYGRERVNLMLKGGYNPLADRMENGNALSWRGTLSYIDQYDMGEMGELGLSIGIQRNETTNPQDRMFASSTWSACDATVVPAEESGRGRFSRYTDNVIDLGGENADNPFYLVGNSLGLRQQGEDDRRDALFASIQWQPDPRWDINLDTQISKRDYTEDRHDLVFADNRRIGPDPVYDENGVLQSYTGTSQLSSDGQYFQRQEDYYGAGLNVAFAADDNVVLAVDMAYSKTRRDDLNRRSRLRSDGLDIYGNPTARAELFPGTGGEVPYTYDYTNSEIPILTVDPIFDLNDHSLYSDDALLLRDRDLTEQEIRALRFDGDVSLDNGFIRSIEGGVRFGRMDYSEKFRRNQFDNADREIDRAVNEACRIDFPQSNFLGNADGHSIQSWATFDTLCLYREYTGSEDFGPPDVAFDPADVTVREETIAVYAMANIDTMLGNMPVRGNIGTRYVITDVRSDSVRAELTIITNEDNTVQIEPTGNFEQVRFKNSTTDWLPSMNLIFELRPDLLLRTAAYRAMARPDPSALGAGRTFSLAENEGTGYANVEEAIDDVRASGSPAREPLRAWNFDASLEWYPNRDTLLSVAAYHKIFQGGIIPVLRDETFVVDGTPITVPVAQQQTTDDTSKLTGIEFNAAHTLTWLPKPLDGLGFKLGLNWAKTDYRSEDISLGDQIDVETGDVIPRIIEPASITGFSKLTYTAQVFYGIGDLDLQAIYKHRSGYHQDFLGGNTQLRYVEGNDVIDLRASYNLSKAIQLRVDAVNITNEPRIDYMPVRGSFRDYQEFGTTYYLGIRARF